MKNQELHQKVLMCFLERLQRKQGDNLLKVVLFGSVARGEEDPSDIDVFVLLKSLKKASDTEDIVDIAYEVDLSEGNCETYISPFVRPLNEYQKGIQQGLPVYKAIQSEGRVLYDAQA